MGKISSAQMDSNQLLSCHYGRCHARYHQSVMVASAQLQGANVVYTLRRVIINLKYMFKAHEDVSPTLSSFSLSGLCRGRANVQIRGDREQHSVPPLAAAQVFSRFLLLAGLHLQDLSRAGSLAVPALFC